MMTTMKAAQISRPGGDWEVVERVIPEPRAGHVRVKVEACGVCHSDAFVKEGFWPGWRIRVYQVMKSRDASMPSATTSPPGGQGSALASAGMAAIVSSAHSAGAGTSPCACIARSRASTSTADTPNT